MDRPTKFVSELNVAELNIPIEFVIYVSVSWVIIPSGGGRWPVLCQIIT